MVVILGAGAAGISAAYHLELLRKEAIVFEKNNEWGGLCSSFHIDGFTFDHAVHLSFTNNQYVRQLFNKSTEYYVHKPEASNFYHGCWLKHPAQNNLYPLDVQEKVLIIKDFIKNEQQNVILENYESWLRFQYGNYFAEHFPMPYTRKYWSMEANLLNTDWINKRMYKPSLEEILMGAMAIETPNVYYAQEMRYPVTGGYKSFLKYMAEKCTIHLSREVISIKPTKKEVYFKDGASQSYDTLISSIPLPELIRIIENVPDMIKQSAEKLVATSIAIVSFGFKRPDIAKYLWFYIYDEDFLPARCYSPSLKSKYNAPKGCSSLQFEIYFSTFKPLMYEENDLIRHIIEKSSQIGLFSEDDIIMKDVRIIPFGNVIFTHDIEKHRQIIHSYLDSLNIKYIGRFGEWDYLWSDQSIESGRKIVSNLN